MDFLVVAFAVLAGLVTMPVAYRFLAKGWLEECGEIDNTDRFVFCFLSLVFGICWPVLWVVALMYLVFGVFFKGPVLKFLHWLER